MSFCSKLPLGACFFTGSLRWSEHFSAMFPGLHICVQVLMKRACFLANACACYCLKAETLVSATTEAPNAEMLSRSPGQGLPGSSGHSPDATYTEPSPRQDIQPGRQKWLLRTRACTWVSRGKNNIRSGRQFFLGAAHTGVSEFIAVYRCARPWKTRCAISCLTSIASGTEGRLWISWEFRG